MQYLFLAFLAVASTGPLLLDKNVASAAATVAAAQMNPNDFQLINETPDKSRGEHSRNRTVHVPSGITVGREVSYDNGRRVVRQNYRFGYGAPLDGTLETEEEFLPHPRLAVMTLIREAHYSLDGKRKLRETFYRRDGTQERVDLFKDNVLTDRILYASDGKTVVSHTRYDKNGNIIRQP